MNLEGTVASWLRAEEHKNSHSLVASVALLKMFPV